MDPDELLEEVNEISRSGVHKLIGADAEMALAKLAHKVNQLIDWMGSGCRPPQSWVRAQRLAPAAQAYWPWVQDLVLDGEIWRCRSEECRAPLSDGSITHTRACTELPGAPARPAGQRPV